MTYQKYTVTISSGAPLGPTGNGFIDNKTIQQYDGTTPGLTFNQCIEKRRANIRWSNILVSLMMESNCNITNIVKTGGSITTPPSAIKFDVEFPFNGQPTTKYDDPILHEIIVYDIMAIKVLVARGLIIDDVGQTEVFDPTLTEAISDKFHTGGIIEQHLAVGPRFQNLETGKLANNMISAINMVSVVAI